MPKPLLQPAIALSLLVLWPLAGLGFPAEVERSSDLLTVTWQSPVTAPYMHDGSLATLEDVLTKHYAVRGKAVSDGAAPSPLLDPLLVGYD
jgi:hypothetical protein